MTEDGRGQYHVKVVGEREILATLVTIQLYLIAEMIHEENEKKKTKVKVPAMIKTMKID